MDNGTMWLVGLRGRLRFCLCSSGEFRLLPFPVHVTPLDEVGRLKHLGRQLMQLLLAVGQGVKELVKVLREGSGFGGRVDLHAVCMADNKNKER